MSNVETIKVIRNPARKLKVVGYARVSTADEHQDSSYRLQINELEKDIRDNSRYEFLGIFKDRKSAKTTKKRQEFNTMIELALMGEIDVIVTKSITRFARNLLDTITIIRELKLNNVEVIFQKENISTLDPSIEMILTILAMHGEEELKNISENNMWSFQRKMRAGGNFTTKLYGYEINGEDWKIINKEARVIRMIFDMYLNNKSYKGIIEHLFELNIKSPKGNKIWNRGTIEQMLQNEKYAGHMALAKTYTRDGVSLRSRRIENLKSMYKNHHAPIITTEVFDKAIALRESRTKNSIKGYVPLNDRVTPFYQFVYSTANERFLKYVVERPKQKYIIPTLYCYNVFHKNRVMITVKNLFLVLNNALSKLSRLTIENSAVFSSVIDNFMNKIEKEISKNENTRLSLLSKRAMLLESKRKLPIFIRRLKNYYELDNIEDFKFFVRNVEILDEGEIKINLNLLLDDVINIPLLNSSISLRVGNAQKDVPFFVFV